jgi:hypothetical protein
MKLQTFGRTPPRDHEVMPGRHCEERSDEAIHASFMPRHGLLRGACHRARIRATRWLAMTVDGVRRAEEEC